MNREVKGLLRYERERAAEIILEGDQWGTDNPLGVNNIPYNGHLSYECSFPADFIKEPTFQKLIEKRKSVGLPTNVLDLFGSGEFVTDMECVDSLTSMKLTKRVVVDQRPFEGHRYFMLDGNLYSGSSWHKLSANMKKQEIGGFDLVVCEPAAGFGNQESDKKDFNPSVYAYLYYSLLGRAYKLMSSHNSMLLTTTPNVGIPDKVVQLWSEKMGACNVSVEYSDLMGTIKMIKTKDSPPVLQVLDYNQLVNEAKPTEGFRNHDIFSRKRRLFEEVVSNI